MINYHNLLLPESSDQKTKSIENVLTTHKGLLKGYRVIGCGNNLLWHKFVEKIQLITVQCLRIMCIILLRGLHYQITIKKYWTNFQNAFLFFVFVLFCFVLVWFVFVFVLFCFLLFLLFSLDRISIQISTLMKIWLSYIFKKHKNQCLNTCSFQGHWTSITSSPNFFPKKLGLLYHYKCWQG